MWFFGYLIEKVITTYEIETESYERIINPIMTSNYYLKNFEWEWHYTKDDIGKDGEQECEQESNDNTEDTNSNRVDHNLDHLMDHRDNTIKGCSSQDDNSSIEEKIDQIKKLNYMSKVLHNLINVDSLDRHIILYYIFAKRGVYRDSNTNKLMNTYGEFQNMCNNYGSVEQFNLYDVNNPCDLKLYNNDYIYETSIAELNFISWIGENGIYDYVINNELFRYKILTEMNEKNLLKGNQFLQYQLIDEEYIENLYTSSIVLSSDTESIDSKNYSHDDENDYTVPLDKLDNDYVMRQLTVEGYMLISRIKNAVQPIFIDIYNQMLEW
jgi:hypothetical protein